jgi:hypothetical protein
LLYLCAEQEKKEKKTKGGDSSGMVDLAEVKALVGGEVETVVKPVEKSEKKKKRKSEVAAMDVDEPSTPVEKKSKKSKKDKVCRSLLFLLLLSMLSPADADLSFSRFPPTLPFRRTDRGRR